MLSLYIITRCESAGEKEKNGKETLEVLESLKCKYKKKYVGNNWCLLVRCLVFWPGLFKKGKPSPSTSMFFKTLNLTKILKASH